MPAVLPKKLADKLGRGHPSSHGFWVTKIVAALLRKPPPMKSKPVKELSCCLDWADCGLDLLHDLERSLERGAVREDDGADVEALIFVGDQAARGDAPSPTVSATMPRNSTAARMPRRSMNTTPSR